MTRWFCVALIAGVCVFSGAVQAQDTVLTVTFPRGGETFYSTRDTLIEITWTGVDDTTAVQLEYSSDNGSRWTVIADSARGGRYLWNVARFPASTTYLVRASQLRPPTASDNVIYSGHSGPVPDAWWNPANDKVVSISADVHVWDAFVSSSTPLFALPAPREDYTSVRWTKDGNRIVVGSENNVAVVANANTNTVEARLNHPASVEKVEVDPTGDWIFTQGADNRARVYSLPGTTARVVHNAGSSINFMTIDSLGQKVLVCANEARIYGRSAGLPVSFTQHSAGVLAGAFSPDGTLVCTVGGDATIRLWNSSSGIELWRGADAVEGVRSVAFSPDGSLVAVGMSDSTISLWNASTGLRVRTIGGYRGAVRMVAFSHDGVHIAGASDDNFARVHEVATGERIVSLQHGDDVRIVRWSADDNRLLTTSNDGTARIWQIREIVLQSSTSQRFAIAPPPPAYALLRAGGDTLDMREVGTIPVVLEGALNLDLARIDSLRITCTYNPSLLFRLSSSVPLQNVVEDVVTDTSGRRKSIASFTVSVPLPLTDAQLFSVTFQATLGQDSVTALTISNVVQIGAGAGLRVETRSAPILVRGICRESGDPRLYTSLGTPLQLRAIGAMPNVHLQVDLPDAGQASVYVYDVLGRCLFTHTATDAERTSRFIELHLPDNLGSSPTLVVVQTETMQTSSMVAGGGR